MRRHALKTTDRVSRPFPTRRNARKRCQPGIHYRRLTCEPLEDRSLLSAGVLDPTFGLGGRVTTNFFQAGTNDQGYDLAIQADGKIVVAGRTSEDNEFLDYERLALIRFNPDGTLDKSFGAGGKVIFDFHLSLSGQFTVAMSVAMDAQGRIVVADDTVVARFNPDGSIDASFGAGSYQVVLGPQILDLQGLPLDQDQDRRPGESPDDEYRAEFTVSVPRIVQHGLRSPAPGVVEAVTLSFSEAMAPDSFSLADDLVSFSGPQGAILPTGYTWVNAQTLQVAFVPPHTPGTCQMVLGPNILSPVGTPLDQDGDLRAGEVPDDRYHLAFQVSAPHIVDSQPRYTTPGPVDSLRLRFDQPMDQTSFAPAEDVSSFSGPQGPIVPTGFAWLDSQTLEIRLAPQRAPGTCRMVFGPNILNSAGTPLDQDRDLAPGESPDDQYTVEFAITSPWITWSQPLSVVPQKVDAISFYFSDAMDQESFSRADDLVSFTGPQGPIVPTGSVWVNSVTLQVTFDPQNVPGAYQMVLGPNILNSAGTPLDQDRDRRAGEVPDDQYTAGFRHSAPRVIDTTPAARFRPPPRTSSAGPATTTLACPIAARVSPPTSTWGPSSAKRTPPRPTWP